MKKFHTNLLLFLKNYVVPFLFFDQMFYVVDKLWWCSKRFFSWSFKSWMDFFFLIGKCCKINLLLEFEFLRKLLNTKAWIWVWTSVVFVLSRLDVDLQLLWLKVSGIPQMPHTQLVMYPTTSCWCFA